MPDNDQPEKIWDEYDWERFLQEQDRKTEKYMELLERYIDDPNRDQIIAREMGWTHLQNKEGQDWADNVDTQFTDELQSVEENEVESMEDDGCVEAEGFERHPLYQAAFVLTSWIDQMFEECGRTVENHSAAVKLSTNVSIATAKLAAALSDDDAIDEIGMTIAYLKRALRAITTGLDCAVRLHDERVINGDRFGALNQRLFQVRDGIIQLMGGLRTEWRRRYGR